MHERPSLCFVVMAYLKISLIISLSISTSQLIMEINLIESMIIVLPKKTKDFSICSSSEKVKRAITKIGLDYARNAHWR